MEFGLVAQLQAHLAPQDHGIKCGQHSALTHSLFPLVPVVTPQSNNNFFINIEYPFIGSKWVKRLDKMDDIDGCSTKN
ncbi:hypothetical protein BCT63_14095 [Vibrio kanaloae]|nr:hypothetical protein BCT63_14095 [Vibrio kanaloae]